MSELLTDTWHTWICVHWKESRAEGSWSLGSRDKRRLLLQ